MRSIVDDTEPVSFVGVHLDLGVGRCVVDDLRVNGRSVVSTLSDGR